VNVQVDPAHVEEEVESLLKADSALN